MRRYTRLPSGQEKEEGMKKEGREFHTLSERRGKGRKGARSFMPVCKKTVKESVELGGGGGGKEAWSCRFSS